jgi:hypothetical protein
VKDPLRLFTLIENLLRRESKSNTISVSVAWEATGKGYDIRTYVSANAGNIFSQDALQAFTYSLNDRHSETLSAIVEPKKTHDKIIAALGMLQKDVGRYAAESAGSKDATQDTTGIPEKGEALKEKLVVELIRDIKSKINIANYTGTDKMYLEGAVKYAEYLSKNVKVASAQKSGNTGWYDGQVNVYIGNATEGDVKTTIFHEYLHHINYLLKIHEYKYENETERKIYEKIDNCFFYKDIPMQEIYEYFMVTLNNRMVIEGWKNKYSDLSPAQQKEVLEYKKKRTYTCSHGKYRPSNYYRDELNVYAICFKLDKVLYVMSEGKKTTYREKINGYEERKQDCEAYESRNNINAKGYEK